MTPWLDPESPFGYDRINREVVRAGHAQGKKPDETLAVRCDSCVFETPVHDPIDFNLLYTTHSSRRTAT